MGLTDKIIQATDTIVSQRLGEVSFDRTVVCTVVEKKGSTYWVDNGSIRFYADALDGKQYSPNQKVYVTVPEGNYNKRKIIMGGYTESEAFGDKFIVNPYDKTTEMWYADIGNIGQLGASSQESGEDIPTPKLNYKYTLPNYEDTYSLDNDKRWVANHPAIYSELTQIGFDNPDLIEVYGGLEYLGFDIQLDCNLFNPFSAQSLAETSKWEYGLKFDIICQNIKEEDISFTHEISSKSFYGNPYCITSNEILYFVVDLPEGVRAISEIKVTPIISKGLHDYLYDPDTQKVVPAAALKYLRFHCGYTTDTIKAAGELVLGTDSVTLDYDANVLDETGKRNLYYRWYDEENDKVLITTPEGENLLGDIVAHWIYYDKDRTIQDIADNYNKASDSEIDSENHQKNNEIREGYEKLYGKYWWPLEEDNYKTDRLINYNLDLTKREFKTKEVKIVLIKNDEVIAQSNSLTFVNKTKKEETVSQLKGSNFVIDDGGITIGTTSITWLELLDKLKPEEKVE